MSFTTSDRLCLRIIECSMIALETYHNYISNGSRIEVFYDTISTQLC